MTELLKKPSVIAWTVLKRLKANHSIQHNVEPSPDTILQDAPGSQKSVSFSRKLTEFTYPKRGIAPWPAESRKFS